MVWPPYRFLMKPIGMLPLSKVYRGSCPNYPTSSSRFAVVLEWPIAVLGMINNSVPKEVRAPVKYGLVRRDPGPISWLSGTRNYGEFSLRLLGQAICLRMDATDITTSH